MLAAYVRTEWVRTDVHRPALGSVLRGALTYTRAS
jgi:hypothetical protein